MFRPAITLAAAACVAANLTSVAFGQVGSDTNSQRGPRFLLAQPDSKQPPRRLDVGSVPTLRKTITLNLDGVNRRAALAEIARQARLDFVYSDAVMPAEGSVRLIAQDITVAAALTEVLLGSGVDVVVSPSGSAALVAANSPSNSPQSQASRAIRGKVTDAAGQPLAGVQISITGTGRGARTNDAGDYRIANVAAGTYTVRAQMLGYAPAEKSVTVAADQPSTLDLQLSRVALTLNEMVVTGTAGPQTRLSQPAQVSVLNTEQLIRATPLTAMATLLQSRLPSVSVTQGSGTTGATQRIRIRGASSISLSNEPLIFIDGMRADARVSGVEHPGESSSSGTGPGGQATSRLNDLNPEDIESLEVVKGPAAATLYGADASAGVIQIITKKGRSGSLQQTLLTEYGRIDAHFTPPDNWAVCTQVELNAGTQVCKGLTPGTLVSDNPLLREGVFRTGHMQSTNWSGSGGSEAFRYYVSLGGMNETGVLPASELRRQTARINTTWSPQVNVTLNVGYGLVGNYNRQPDDNHSLYGILTNAMQSATPLTLGLANNGWLATRRAADMAAIKNTIDLLRNMPTVEINYRTTDWFTNRLVLGGDFSSEQKLRFIPKNSLNLYRSEHNPGLVRETRSNYRQFTADYLGHTTGKFGRDRAWGSDLAVGLQMIMIRTDNVWCDGSGLATNSAHVCSAAAQSAGGQQLIDQRSLGYLGQYQLSYRDRAFVQTGLRVDKNSTFGENVQAMYLPKVGASWVISEEPFFKRRFRQLNTLRLRAAYGVTGRAPQPGSAVESWQPSPYASSSTTIGPGLDLLNPGNASLRPERGSEFEAGVDASLLENRFGLELSYFRKLTRDLILQRQLPPSVGYLQNPFANIGKVLNDGIEAVLTAQLINRRPLAWDVRVAMNTLHNELLDLGGLPPFGQFERFVEGRPLSAFFSPRVKRLDLANNVAIVSDTLEFVGGKLPKFESGLTSSLAFFGNLRFAVQFDAKAGFKMYNSTNQVRDQAFANNRAAVDAAFLPQAEHLRRFGPFVTQSGTKLNVAQVREPYIEDGDFVRFRELSVSYNLPPTLSRGLRAQRATIQAGGRNLALWTKYTGFDPEAISGIANPSEVNFGQDEYFNLPPSRRFFLRLTLDF